VLEGALDLTDVKEMVFSSTEFTKYELKPKDILLVEASGSPAQLGRAAMYDGEPARVGYQNSLLRFRSGPRLDPDFALLVFRHFVDTGFFRALARGSTSLAHLSRTRVAAGEIPIPPLGDQRRIAEEAGGEVAVVREQRRAIEKSMERLGQMKLEILTSASWSRRISATSLRAASLRDWGLHHPMSRKEFHR
jgi:type I restriction enzyme S subunit